MTKQDTSYKLQVDEQGYVWYSHAQDMPVCSARRVSEFVNRSTLKSDDTAKLIGSHNNIPLILRLYEQKTAGQLRSLQLCTPLACSTIARRSKPDVVLMDISQKINSAASVGGFHEFTEDDFPSYFMARNYSIGAQYESMLGVLKTHVVYQPIQFIPHLNLERLSRLLSLLLDPRWYIDPASPDKTIKMEGFLFLLPNVQLHTTNNKQPTEMSKIAFDRCKLVMDTWKNDKPTSKEEYTRPNNFLWRIHATEGTGHLSDLRASQTFICFLRNIWLNALYKRRGVSDGLFIPEYFFKHKSEVNAYKQLINGHNHSVV